MKKRGMMKNKRGWIRIVEAFVAILLIAGVLLVVINKGYFGKKDISERIYDIELSILREIELNRALRGEILAEGGTPINWDSVVVPQNVKDKIDTELQNYPYLECEARICEMDKICALGVYPDKDVYAQAVAITATLEEVGGEKGKYSPRQLKLFCWVV